MLHIFCTHVKLVKILLDLSNIELNAKTKNIKKKKGSLSTKEKNTIFLIISLLLQIQKIYIFVLAWVQRRYMGSCPLLTDDIYRYIWCYHIGSLYLTYGTSTSSPSLSLQQSSNTSVRICGLTFFLDIFSTICDILKK